MTTLQDLIQKGVEVRNARLEAERKLRQEEEQRLARERAEAEQAILALFPSVLHQSTKVEMPSSMNYARVEISLPSGGKVNAYVTRGRDGWEVLSEDSYYFRQRMATYDATSPTGYFSRFFTLEEAVAYAAGAIS